MAKFLNLLNNILVLLGIYYAIQFIYTKEIEIQIHGYTVNTIHLLILIITLVVLNKAHAKSTTEETN